MCRFANNLYEHMSLLAVNVSLQSHDRQLAAQSHEIWGSRVGMASSWGCWILGVKGGCVGVRGYV